MRSELRKKLNNQFSERWEQTKYWVSWEQALRDNLLRVSSPGELAPIVFHHSVKI